MRTPIRHGEVMLLPVNATPPGTAEKVTSCIVGHCEAGHHHVLDSDREFARIVSASGTVYVELDVPTRLIHQKEHERHRDLEVPAGVWRVVRKMAFVEPQARDAETFAHRDKPRHGPGYVT